MGDKKHIEGHWIHDLESYPNIFTCCVCYANGGGLRVFEISDRKNEVEPLLEFLRKVKKHNHFMVGFNNTGYDYVLIHYILMKSKEAIANKTPLVITAQELYAETRRVIESNRGERFGISIKASEVIIPQIDLYKIHHFDNKARSTSLKMLEFNMRSNNIEDLPFPVGKILTEEEMDVLIEYNKHDVRQTLKFYNESVPAIEFRNELSKKYGFDCTNYNDTKIGKEYFINSLEKANPGCCYAKSKYGRKVKQTKRSEVVIGNIIFPYVSFDRPEFRAVLDWFKSQVITETKGVFSDIRECDLGDVAKYAEMVVKRKKFQGIPSVVDVSKLKAENPLMWIEEKQLVSPKGAKSYWMHYNLAENLNVVIDGFRFDFGTGGIHGSIASQTVRSDDEFVIIDADVTSMYPNIAIANEVYPEHLGKTFCKIYSFVFEERKRYPKGSAENAVMKLALNGVYGDSNNEYSPLYDPQYTMAVTINGQLSLCMLAEKLITIEGCSLIQCNTDGVTVKIPRSKKDQYDVICNEWQKVVGLDLEFVEYSAMYIRDVNNYIGQYVDGHTKNKGAYEYEGIGWHKNHSSLVIPMAAEHEILGRGAAEEFILAHDNMWDFMLRTKVDRKSRLVLVMEDGSEIQQQNICRYYPSTKGGKLVKIMPPLPDKEDQSERRLSIEAEWSVVPCNDINEFNWDINYDYYYAEARKLIDPLKGGTVVE